MDKLFSKILTVITVPAFGNGSFLNRKIRLLFLCFFLLPSIVFSIDFPPERSTSDADNEIGWLVAPLPIVVEGIGTGVPIAASISNVYKNTDLLMAKTFFKGDFEVSLFSISKFPLIKEKLLFSLGLTDFYMPFRSYDRGIDSGEEDYYQTLEKYNSNFVTFQSQYFKQRLEFLLRYSAGGTKVEKIFDVDGNEFSNVQSPERSWIDYEIGTYC